MSTTSLAERLPWESDEPLVEVFNAPGFPPGHPAEPDLFSRQLGVPGHDQAALERARVVMVGAGGLGSWTGLGLVRSGVRNLTIIDPDRFERSNAHRQLVFPQDLGRCKASSLARNLVPHLIAGGRIVAVNLAFEEAIKQNDLQSDVVLGLVDNNRCRFALSRWARSRRVPVVFAMLSLDGMRLHTFLQGPASSDACLWCALPNLDPEGIAPCAAGVLMPSCLLAAANAVFSAYCALIGWPMAQERFNWWERDLVGRTRDGAGLVTARPGCAVCAVRFGV